jgi:hypothetical protein
MQEGIYPCITFHIGNVFQTYPQTTHTNTYIHKHITHTKHTNTHNTHTGSQQIHIEKYETKPHKISVKIYVSIANPNTNWNTEIYQNIAHS